MALQGNRADASRDCLRQCVIFSTFVTTRKIPVAQNTKGLVVADEAQVSIGGLRRH
jgi:hypothetical protein